MATRPCDTSHLPAPAEAVAALVARLSPVDTERVMLNGAAGRVLAEPVRADRPNPPCDVSAMDGYALRLADTGRSRVPVLAEVSVGEKPPHMEAGCAVRIFTGGAVPVEAEAVIKREDVREHPGAIDLSVELDVDRGMNIRRRGENAPAGSVAAVAGSVASAATSGVLATFGFVQISVRRRVRVAILVTGNELLPVESAPEPWQIRDSNGPALAAMLERVPWLDGLPPRRVPDRPDVLHAALGGALEACDAVVLTGGVSMGDYDFVPATIQAVGGEVVFHKLAQRPGKPMLGAIGPDGQAILGLPGNPISAMVTMRRWGSVVLRKLAGFAEPDPPVAAVTVRNPDEKRLNMCWHRPVKLTAPGEVELVESRGSGDLISAARADGFVELPPGASGSGPWPFYAWDLS